MRNFVIFLTILSVTRSRSHTADIVDLEEYCSGSDLTALCEGLTLEDDTNVVFDTTKKFDYLSIVFFDCLMFVIPNNTFKVFYNVEFVQMAECRINRLDKWNFDGGSGVHKLILAGNEVEVLTDDVFGDLVTLNHLDLEANFIQEIESNAFNNLSNLHTLYLSFNFLESISKDIFAPLTSLKVLHLDHNEIDKIDANAFEYNLNLTEISFRHNKLKFIDDRIYTNHIALEFIQKNFNKTTEVLNVIVLSKLKNLEKLNFAGNYFGHVSVNTFSNLKNLKALNLSLTNLTELERGAFKTNPELRSLDVSQNQLRKLNLDENTWRNLHDIYVNKNQLSEINFWLIANSSKINALTLRDNMWNCTFLTEMVVNLKSKKIAVGMDPFYAGNETHAFGIPCSEISSSLNVTITSPKPENILSDPVVTTKQPVDATTSDPQKMSNSPEICKCDDHFELNSFNFKLSIFLTIFISNVITIAVLLIFKGLYNKVWK